MNDFNTNNLDHLSSKFEQYEAPFSADEMSADWQQVSTKIGASTQSGANSGGTSQGLLSSVGAKLSVALIGLSAIVGVYSLVNKTQTEEMADEVQNSTAVTEVVVDQKPSENFSPNKASSTNQQTITQNQQLPEKGSNTKASIVNESEASSVDSKPSNRNNDTNTNTNPVVADLGTASEINNNAKLLKPSLVVSSNQVCQLGYLRLKVNNATPKALYWFNMVNDQNGRTETGTISGSKLIKLDIAGKYELRVFEMLGDANTVIAENQILVNKKPKAKLSSKTLECGKVEFMSESTNATNAIWNFDGKSFTGNNVEYSFKNEGYQKVMLVAQNEHCADTVVKEVYTLASMRSIENLELPNIFTPNADGDNDEWNVLLKNPQLKNVEGQIEVYSAQNELVFKSINGLSDKWNGKLMNVGSDCKQGMYRYIISFYNPCGNKESKIIKGLISIKR